MKTQHDERVISEYTVLLEIIAQDAFILVLNASKSLVAGAYSTPPDSLAVMGWDGDLVATLVGVNFVPTCS